MKNREDTKERIGLVQVLLLALIFVVCYLSAVVVLTPQRYDVLSGGTAPETITAPRTIEDAAATAALRDAARKDTKEIYKLDAALIETYTMGARTLFEQIQNLRQDAANMRSASAAGAGFPVSGYQLTLEEWKTIVSDADMQSLLEGFVVELTLEDGFSLLQASESELLRLQDAVLPRLTTSLESGLQQSALASRKTAYVQELNATSIPDALKSIGEKAFDAFLRPTFVPDELASEQARESAAAAVEPVEIKRGDVIVEQGAVVTQEQYEILRSLELVRLEDADVFLNLGVALYMLCIGACFAFYLLLYHRPVFAHTKSMLVIATAMVLSMLLALLLIRFDSYISPALIGVMLIALLVDSKVAMAANVVLALCIGVLAGGRGAAMMGFQSMTMSAAILVGGQTGIYMLRKYNKRGTMIAAGAIAGAASALVLLAAHVMTEKTLGTTAVAAAWAFGSNVVAAVLVVGTLTLWENLFDVATSARLNELSNTNTPLLKRLMTEAPGTYHHSMMTASLAEAAAEAIGADALLVRVGAYYHDVGKLRRPLYFKENQKPNENIHDTLPPGESATIIIAHQRDGVVMLNKAKLPSAIVQIAFEHHGNTLAAYFYHKAAQENGGKAMPQKLFRYPGARPTTKESAIVMLADSCEAAVRSLDSPGRENVEELVTKIIKGKIDDGQLAQCPLNFKEITLIHASFLRTFDGMLHERIAYPDQESAR